MVDGDNVEMADKVIYESVYSTTFLSRSEIQLTKSEFKLIRSNDGRKS